MQLHKVTLTPFEVETIGLIDDKYMEYYAKEQAKKRPPK